MTTKEIPEIKIFPNPSSDLLTVQVIGLLNNTLTLLRIGCAKMGKIILDDKEKKLPKLQNKYLGHSIHIIKNKLITIFNTERPSIKKDIKQSLNQTINVSVDEITIEHQSDILNFLTHSPSYLKHQLQVYCCTLSNHLSLREY